LFKFISYSNIPQTLHHLQKKPVLIDVAISPLPGVKIARTEYIVACAEDNVACTEDNVARAEDRVARTEDIVACAENNVARTEYKVACAEDRVAHAEDNIVRAEDNVACTEDNIVRAEDRVACTVDRVAHAEDNIVCTEDNVACTKNKVVHAKAGSLLPQYIVPLFNVNALKSSILIQSMLNQLKLKIMKKNEFRIVPAGNGRIILLAIVPSGTTKRVLAVLRMRKITKIGDFTNKMKFIRTEIKQNAATFPTPPVSVADNGTFDTDIKAFDAAETLALTKVKGSVQARNLAKVKVLNDVHLLMGYVQGIADANPANAEVTIANSGFEMKTIAPHSKSDFSAKNTKISGTVKLDVNVKKVTNGEKRFSFKWQQSPDAGITIIDLPGTLNGSTLVPRLTVGLWAYFRFLVILKDGEQGWSEWVKILVS